MDTTVYRGGSGRMNRAADIGRMTDAGRMGWGNMMRLAAMGCAPASYRCPVPLSALTHATTALVTPAPTQSARMTPVTAAARAPS